MISSHKSALINGPRISSSKNSSNKFGFSTEQYKKLQIIKAARPLNLKLIVSLNRLKYSKFYFCTLCALIELINVVHNHEKVEISDWQSLITYINQNQSKMLINISETPSAWEKGTFDKQKLCESRKNYFGDVPSETLLYKYCLNSKEIRTILQFMFTVYNFIQDLRKKEKPRKIKKAIMTEQSESDSKNVNKKAEIMSSNDSKLNKNYLSRSTLQSERMSSRKNRNIKSLNANNLETKFDIKHRGSAKHNFRGNLTA